jgi:hypothetical protein
MRVILENFCQSFSCQNLWLLHTGLVLGGTAALHALRAWGAVIFCTSHPKMALHFARGSIPMTFGAPSCGKERLDRRRRQQLSDPKEESMLVYK